MDRRFFSVIILMTIVGAVSMILYFREPVETGSIKLYNLPMDISGWRGQDLALDKKTYEILETRNVLMRKYESPAKESVYIYIVASKANRRVAHPPEVCYIGDGVEIVEKTLVKFPVPGLKDELLTNSFISRKDGRESLVFYWYKSGNRFTAHYLVQQVKVVFNQMLGKTNTVALIRISTAIDNGDRTRSFQTLREFSGEVIPMILKYLP